MKTCNKCGSKMRLAQKFCDQCGQSEEEKAASSVIACASCGITQERYREVNQWRNPAKGRQTEPDGSPEKPHPYRTHLHGFMDKHYCDDCHPQMRYSLRKFRELEQLLVNRRNKPKEAA